MGIIGGEVFETVYSSGHWFDVVNIFYNCFLV